MPRGKPQDGKTLGRERVFSDMEYKVSVIVPVYKVEKYLAQCLDQLAAQTLTGDRKCFWSMMVRRTPQAIIDQYTEQYPHLFKAL